MKKVYLQKGKYSLSEDIKARLEKIFDPKHEIVIKIHFGEPGNKTAFKVEDIEPITSYLKKIGYKIVLFDSPVVYPSKRNTESGYKEVAFKKGFDKLGEIVISNEGESFKSKDYKGEVCRVLTEAKNVLVISHVKGHPQTGYAGAVKNLGMGGVTSKTKGIIHDLSIPKYDSEKCTGCGLCAKYCLAGVISIKEGKARFNSKDCWGGSLCTFVCPNGCFTDDKLGFDDALAQAAIEVIKRLSGNVCYINFLKNITKLCDCEVDAGEIIADDVGLLFSECPVAIDKASVDIINKQSKEEVFKKIWIRDPLLHVKLAAKYLDCPFDYVLENISQ